MSRSKHTEAQMIGALKQVEAGRKAEDVAREVGVSKHTLYAWKAKYGGMDVSQAQEAKYTRVPRIQSYGSHGTVARNSRQVRDLGVNGRAGCGSLHCFV